MVKKIGKGIKIGGIILLLFLVIGLLRPTWTPGINGDNSISELRKVNIGDTELEVMIRGNDRENPVVIFVHGGPCWSEIPYARKYQKDLEKDFTVVHYDQRGSGKSYEFGKDYEMVTAATHVDDLILLTEYVKEYLEREQVILAGHSYGTYIATITAAERPDLYEAYIGIGQVANTIESDLISLHNCIAEAEKAGKEKDVNYLKSLETSIAKGERITPRNYVRKYGFATRKINDNVDYWRGFLFGPEYNLLDAIRIYTASYQYQDALKREDMDNSITDIVTEINIPVYFVMGKYDGMTSAEAAQNYLNKITGNGAKEFLLFEESAHYPQFEEELKFYQWMKETFH